MQISNKPIIWQKLNAFIDFKYGMVVGARPAGLMRFLHTAISRVSRENIQRVSDL